MPTVTGVVRKRDSNAPVGGSHNVKFYAFSSQGEYLLQRETDTYDDGNPDHGCGFFSVTLDAGWYWVEINGYTGRPGYLCVDGPTQQDFHKMGISSDSPNTMNGKVTGIGPAARHDLRFKVHDASRAVVVKVNGADQFYQVTLPCDEYDVTVDNGAADPGSVTLTGSPDPRKQDIEKKQD